MAESPVISELESVITREPVDEVFIALPGDEYAPLVEEIVRLCEEQGITVRLET